MSDAGYVRCVKGEGTIIFGEQGLFSFQENRVKCVYFVVLIHVFGTHARARARVEWTCFVHFYSVFSLCFINLAYVRISKIT